MYIDVILLSFLVVASLLAVMKGTLIRAAIALAVVSVMLSMILYRLGAPLAAVFELSVCAGLITVVFMSTISLTKPMNYFETMQMTRDRIKRFWYLPVIIIILGVTLAFVNLPIPYHGLFSASSGDVKNVIWNLRQFDLFGQILILFLGAFAVAVLFKDKPKDESEI